MKEKNIVPNLGKFQDAKNDVKKTVYSKKPVAVTDTADARNHMIDNLKKVMEAYRINYDDLPFNIEVNTQGVFFESNGQREEISGVLMTVAFSMHFFNIRNFDLK